MQAKHKSMKHVEKEEKLLKSTKKKHLPEKVHNVILGYEIGTST